MNQGSKCVWWRGGQYLSVPTSTAVGVARPSAHGHATTSTEAAIWMPSSSGALAAPDTNAPDTYGLMDSAHHFMRCH